MGLFSRKSKVDYDLVFREQYKSLNRIHQQARDELDYKVKESLMEVVVEKYRELLELIDKGAKQDPEHFEALKKNAEDELQTIKNINEDA
ncbi:hypothetical protein [uncultured Catenibacterium sp.]|uniref:hypothetical protein n=1 Tax=uncultured Catenibacterium sp. TaxID=286142 RepID=UPI0025DF9401|nr:hypothetical protein [uncultured Catenibacterium sp.]